MERRGRKRGPQDVWGWHPGRRNSTAKWSVPLGLRSIQGTGVAGVAGVAGEGGDEAKRCGEGARSAAGLGWEGQEDRIRLGFCMIFQDCGNKSPRTEWLRTTKIYSFAFLEATSLKARHSRASLALKATEGNPPLLFQLLGPRELLGL